MLDRLDVAGRRLHNQRLIGDPLPDPVAVVRHLCAVQAQDYAGATWALAQRTPGATGAEIDALVDAGAIVRTHLLRPTWQFVLPEDVRWLLALTGQRVHAVNGTYYRKLELDEATLRRGDDLMARALERGNHLTRAELRVALHAVGIDSSGLRLSYLVMHAELNAVICNGPRRGKQITYALLDERVPPTAPRDREAAVAEITRRYFLGHGPATLNDFAWWSGLTVADGRAGVAAAGTALASETVGGKAYWFPPEAPAPLASPVVHLLPNYDEHLVAYRDHTPSLDPALVGRVGSTSESLAVHIIVRDGLVVGGWRRIVKARGVTIETDLLVPLAGAEQASLDAAAAGFGRFVGLPVTVVPKAR